MREMCCDRYMQQGWLPHVARERVHVPHGQMSSTGKELA